MRWIFIALLAVSCSDKHDNNASHGTADIGSHDAGVVGADMPGGGGGTDIGQDSGSATDAGGQSGDAGWSSDLGTEADTGISTDAGGDAGSAADAGGDAGADAGMDMGPGGYDTTGWDMKRVTLNDSASTGTPDSYFFDVEPGSPLSASITGGGSGTWSVNVFGGYSNQLYPCSGQALCQVMLRPEDITVIVTAITTDIGSYGLTVDYAGDGLQ